MSVNYSAIVFYGFKIETTQDELREKYIECADGKKYFISDKEFETLLDESDCEIKIIRAEENHCFLGVVFSKINDLGQTPFVKIEMEQEYFEKVSKVEAYKNKINSLSPNLYLISQIW